MDRITLYRIAWSATFLCIVIGVLVARTWLRQSWRLYSAMALFTCGWLLVLPTYATPTDMLSVDERKLINFCQDIAVILFTFTGGLLVGDVHTKRAGHPVDVSWELRTPMALLFLLAFPTAISIPTSPFGALIQQWLGIDKVSDAQVGDVVGLVLTLVGFYSLARGVYEMRGPTMLFKVFATILVFYWAIGLYRAFETWTSYVPTKEVYVLTVSSAKLLVTVLFAWAVVAYVKRGPSPIRP